MTNTVLTYNCYELGLYKSKNSQAIISFDETGKPKGIICDFYKPKTGECNAKMKKIDHILLEEGFIEETEKYTKRYNALYAAGDCTLALGNGRDKILHEVILEEIERQRQQRIKELGFNVRCAVAEGFKVLK